MRVTLYDWVYVIKIIHGEISWNLQQQKSKSLHFVIKAIYDHFLWEYLNKKRVNSKRSALTFQREAMSVIKVIYGNFCENTWYMQKKGAKSILKQILYLMDQTHLLESPRWPFSNGKAVWNTVTIQLFVPKQHIKGNKTIETYFF